MTPTPATELARLHDRLALWRHLPQPPPDIELRLSEIRRLTVRLRTLNDPDTRTGRTTR